MTGAMAKPRVAPAPREQWTAEQAAVLTPILESKGALNILGTFARHWPAYIAFSALGRHVMGPTSTLTARHRELIILRTALACEAEYEWAQHKPQARDAGLSDAEIERVKLGPDAEGWTVTEAVLLRAVDELVADKVVSDPVWVQLTQALSIPQIFDLIYCVGQYTMVAMLAKTCGVQIDPGFSGY